MKPAGRTFYRRLPRSQVEREVFGRVVQKNFSYEGKKRGVWYGRVEGNGTIQLRLHLVAAGKEETRYMGTVALAHKSTSFRFESSVPGIRDWTWNISVQAS